MAQKVEGSPVKQEHRGTCGNRGRSIPGSSLGWTDFRGQLLCLLLFKTKQNSLLYSADAQRTAILFAQNVLSLAFRGGWAEWPCSKRLG